MAVKTDRLEARLSPDERGRIEQAASTTGLSVSAFVVEVAVERADEIIAAATTAVVPAVYFALAPHLLMRDDAPQRLARGSARQIPAILLAELAVDSRLHGTGLGADLLVHALGTILDAARRAGGRVVLVDAIDDDAREFYERHDFQVLPGRPRRLVGKLGTVANALGTPWP